MKEYNSEKIKALDKIARMNLVNSCTGYKSANLIGTVSKEGNLNLAVFSSVTHLGSSPAMLGFVLRPTTVPRHTYKNIRETDFFTVNHITAGITARAHHTSAAYDEGVSEFEVTGLQPEFMPGVQVPFVKASPVRLLCKYLNEYPIVENGTLLIVASIEKIYVEEQLLSPDHTLRLDAAEIMAITGLDGYALPKLMHRYEYARSGVQPTTLQP